jgi:hypothetical protein
MVGCHVVKRTKHGLLITQEAIANPLLSDQSIGRLGDLPEGGVHTEERQQGNDQQPTDAPVAVIDLPFVLRQQFADPELATGQGQDDDCRRECADEAESKQDQRKPRTDVAEDHRDPEGEFGTKPAQEVDAHDDR